MAETHVTKEHVDPTARGGSTQRSSRASDWPLDRLADAKGATTVSVVLPALNEAATVGSIVDAVRRDLVDVARAAGRRAGGGRLGVDRRHGAVARPPARAVVTSTKCCLRFPRCPARAKRCGARWPPRAATSSCSWTPTCCLSASYVAGLARRHCSPTRRIFRQGHVRPPARRRARVHPSGGGRVTELVARPLLNLHWPQLAGFVQPLAGEYAARRTLLEQLPFATGYGVELAMLIDTERKSGWTPWRRSTSASAAIDTTTTSGSVAWPPRSGRRARAASRDGDSTPPRQRSRSSCAAGRATGYRPIIHDVTALERPPMATMLRDEELTTRGSLADERPHPLQRSRRHDGRPRRVLLSRVAIARRRSSHREPWSRCTMPASRCRWCLAAPARNCKRRRASSAPTAYIAEMGAIIGWDHGRRSTMLTGQTPPEFAGPLVAQLESIGLVDALLGAFDGRLEHHAPWHLGHETDVMLHGLVDVEKVNMWLTDRGFAWLVFVDNGRLNDTVMEGLDERPHIYHLMARGISKGLAIAADLERRGLTASNAVAVGDSLSDLVMAPYVERFFLVANGAEVPSIREAAEALPNVTVCAGPVGAGWAEAAR